MNEQPLRDVLETLQQSVDGLLVEIKSMHTHHGSAWYFLQCTAEDLLRAVQELKAAMPPPP